MIKVQKELLPRSFTFQVKFTRKLTNLFSHLDEDFKLQWRNSKFRHNQNSNQFSQNLDQVNDQNQIFLHQFMMILQKSKILYFHDKVVEKAKRVWASVIEKKKTGKLLRNYKFKIETQSLIFHLLSERVEKNLKILLDNSLLKTHEHQFNLRKTLHQISWKILLSDSCLTLTENCWPLIRPNWKETWPLLTLKNSKNFIT